MTMPPDQPLLGNRSNLGCLVQRQSNSVASFHHPRSPGKQLVVRNHPRNLTTERQQLLTNGSSSQEALLLPGPSGVPRHDDQDDSYLAPGLRELVNSDVQELPALPPPTDPEDESDEPDPKRLRLGSYEIALAAAEGVLTSYAEAIRSQDADKLREAVRAEIRSHVRNHTWDLVR